ncbi:hypothetical protein N2152v2_009093 [Parachlorella kessleri]
MQCLWQPPELAGYLEKQGHSRKNWRRRFFILRAPFLFYFKERQKTSKLYKIIPIENAKIESEVPAGKALKKYIITIAVHASHALTCHYPFYVLAAPREDIQAAWVNALWQAAIPRRDLINALHQAGRLTDLVASYAQSVSNCYPVADAEVLGTGASPSKLSGLGDNLGTLVSSIRNAHTSIRQSILGMPRRAEPKARESVMQLAPALSTPKAAAEALAQSASSTPSAKNSSARTPFQATRPTTDSLADARGRGLPELTAASMPNSPTAPASTARGAPPLHASVQSIPAALAAAAAAGLTLPPGLSLDCLASADAAQLESLLQALAGSAVHAPGSPKQKLQPSSDSSISWASNPLAGSIAPPSSPMKGPADASVVLRSQRLPAAERALPGPARLKELTEV